MKMLISKMAFLCSGLGIMGYLYYKKNPDMMKQMKKMGKDITKSLYMYLDK